MKTIKTILYTASLLTLASLVLSGCQKDNDTTTLRVEIAQLGSSDKTYIDDERYTCWTNGDRVRVNDVDYTLYLNDNECYINNIPVSEIGYTAMAPAGLATSQTTMSSTSITNIQLPNTYSYHTGDVPVVMAGHLSTATGTITFQNACMVMKLNLTNNYSHDLRISNVKISDNVAPLSGSFQINDIGIQEPTLVATTGNSTSREVMIQMTESDPLDLESGETIAVYAVLPPTENYNNNIFTIEVEALDLEAADNGSIIIYHFSHQQLENASGCIPRNTLVPVGIDLDSPHTTTLKGLGTENNPYRIGSAYDLAAMEQLVNRGYDPIGLGEPFASAYYIQTRNIGGIDFDDFDENAPTNFRPIGNAENNFTGTYDGGGNLIRIQSITGDECVGLFGYISNGAVIKNIALDVMRVTSNSEHSAIIGGICGHAEQSTIDRCILNNWGQMDVYCNATQAYIGGIVGELSAKNGEHCLLTNCCCAATIGSSTDNSHYYIGGIAGHVQNSHVVNSCYIAWGPYAEDSYVGGIAGRADGISYITNCYKVYDPYSEGAYYTNNTQADICGQVGSQCHINFCYYHDKLYASGNPSYPNIANNMQYSSYRNATGNSSNGLTTLRDYLQQYVTIYNGRSNSLNGPLCKWVYEDEYYEDIENFSQAPRLEIGISAY